MNELECKVLVLGGGPGGYVAGIRAGQLGLDTILVEGGKLGGCCLNVGCIPSKAFIHTANEYDLIKRYSEGSETGISTAPTTIALPKTVAWKDDIVSRLNTGVAGLLKKAKVRIVEGWGEMRDGKTCVVKTADGETRIKAEHVILATGSTSVELPALPFGDKVISSTEMLSLTEVPKKLAVVGGGYIGLELGIAFRKLGSDVTVVEATNGILPLYDRELTKPVKDRMDNLKIRVMLETFAKGLDDKGNLRVETLSGEASSIEADKILVTVGRKPRTDGWGLDNMDLAMDGRFIRIDQRCHTSMRNVWAIGDVTGEPMLAHRAMAQGEMVAEIIAGEARTWDKVCIPAVCFTDPEVVSAGMSEAEAKASGFEVITAQFPYKANGRAMTMEDESGFVRIIARKDNHLVLGIQAVGGEVSELSAQFALALEMGARLEDIGGTIHAHPTKSEAVQEAALKALGHALHI
ncbi:dihydrolipoyl dehydrogenase [Parvularcula flava]|uniref:Dihydrolipoyl dehydrogenase n=1 Tax=Aquisalinus luteolus TaxID=1566827 RepID=A0A8J3A4W0_9PROT|nr:dihydrolipoyl dehydrogenase [Aquisalinus luteolus]NHK28511.1 dihydrolipoyl dehydrogenase [Aquisalinus luteolus]GGH98700.1 dihydrolipoyl dehydrogenase [Aquisalinus luteolus]